MANHSVSRIKIYLLTIRHIANYTNAEIPIANYTNAEILISIIARLETTIKASASKSANATATDQHPDPRGFVSSS